MMILVFRMLLKTTVLNWTPILSRFAEKKILIYDEIQKDKTLLEGLQPEEFTQEKEIKEPIGLNKVFYLDKLRTDTEMGHKYYMK